MNDLLPTQKTKIMRVYVEYLNLRVEVGIPPREEEIELVREAVNRLWDDFMEVLDVMYSHLRNMAKQITSVRVVDDE